MRTHAAASVAVALLLAVASLSACGSDDPAPSADEQSSEPSSSPESETSSDESTDLDEVVQIGDRGLYVRCSGVGSPTVLLEGGDEDTSTSYSFAESALADVTRTCVYDRANLGHSDPDPGPRGLTELVADVEGLLEAGEIPGPYVLVGTSGGGYISAGYAFAHPDEVAGMVFVEVPAPFIDPPAELVRDARWDSPVNIENRNYLEVEKDAWAARRPIGDIPFTVISNEYSASEIEQALLPSERRGMKTNVSDQRGWLVLSPSAQQVVVHTGHAVEEADPGFVLQAILDVVTAARAASPAEPATAALVGEWSRETTCQQRVEALRKAGLGAYAAEHAAGEGWIPGVTSPDQLEDPKNPCEGAVPLEHSHFFTEDGLFGSRDDSGNQVDDGTYRLTDDRTVVIDKEFGEVTFHFTIGGDTLLFEPVMPACVKSGCFAAQWAVAVAYPGLPWKSQESVAEGS